MKTYTEEKRIRPHILTAAVFWSVILMMLFNVVSVRIFGEVGVGYCSGPLILYYVLYVSFVLAVQKAVYIMVRLRARRSQFINAEINMKRSYRIFVFTGILLAILLVTCSYAIAKQILGMPKIYLHVIMVGISLVFLCGQGVARGYLQGLGYTKPIVISDVLIAVCSFASGAIGSGILYNYGKKVNDLFHGDEYSAIYGASGVVMGLLFGSVVGFLQIITSMTLRKAEISAVVKNGAPRYLDNKNDVITGIRPIIYLYSSPVLMVLVDYVLYNIIHLKNGDTESIVFNYGAYAGRVSSLMVLITLLCCVPFVKSWNRVMARIERDELEGARDRLRSLFHFWIMMLVPVTIFIFTSSEQVQVAVFGKNYDLVQGLSQCGAFIVILLAVGIFLSWLLNHMGKSLLLVVNVTIAWGVHVALLVLLFVVMKLDLMGILIAQEAAFAVFDVVTLLMLFKMLKYRYRIVFSLGLPLLASAVAGLVLLLINKIFVNIIGEMLTLLVGILVFTIVYMLMLIVLKGVRTEELERIPLGRLFMHFAHRIQHDRYYEE